MEKFRLAVCNTQPPNLYFGGVERRIIQTAKRLQDQADITVYSGTKRGLKQPTFFEDVKIMPCHSTDRVFPLDNWTFNRSLGKETLKIEADLFEAHNVSGYGILGRLEKNGLKTPFIHTIHGVLADEYEQAKKGGSGSTRGWLANLFMKQLAQKEAQTSHKASLIVTVSNYSKQKILQHYHVSEEKIHVVPNGVDAEKYKPNPNPADVEAAKRGFGVEGKLCVLFVGNLVPRKGLLFLIKAAKKVVESRADVVFLIAGEGPQKSLLQSHVEAENLSGNFRFLGGVKDSMLPSLYGCCDVFVLPSVQEGQGIVLLESQASGKPVVAFDVGGVGEALVNGESGLLAESGNTAEFSSALLRLLSDVSMREQMGAAGRRFVLENFTWNLCAQRMLKVYREALSH
jgi:glycogen synthase